MTWRSSPGAQALLAAALLCAPLACSVKEDRSPCPVYVTVLTDRYVQQGLYEGVVSFAAATPLAREAVRFADHIREGIRQACPRDYARVSVLAGVPEELLTAEALTIPPGREAPPAWAFGVSFSAWADEYVVDAEPHKQFCRVRFLFDGSPTAPDDYPWRFRLLADCAGMDLYTLEPLPGDYRVAVGPDADGQWRSVLPRQRDNRLTLEVYVPDGDDPSEGRTEYLIDLGQAFAQQGYDWTLPDLRDIEVQVGFTQAELTVTVREWERDEHYQNVEI